MRNIITKSHAVTLMNQHGTATTTTRAKTPMTQRREDDRPPLVRPFVRKICYVLIAANVVVYGLPWVIW